MLIFVLLPEPSPRLLTAGPALKTCLRQVFLTLRRRLRSATRGLAPGPHFIFFEKKTKQKKLNAACGT